MSYPCNQTRQVREVLQRAGVDLAGIRIWTTRIATGTLQTLVSGFTRPMTGDETVTAQVDVIRARIADELGAVFSAVDSNYGWVSVTVVKAA